MSKFIHNNKNRKEIFGFLLTGTLSFLVDTISFNVFLLLGVNVYASNVTSICLSAIFGFIGNTHYSFSHVTKSSYSKTMLKYSVFSVLSIVIIGTVTSFALFLVDSKDILVINFVRTSIIIFSVVFRFIGLKFFVYAADKLDASSNQN